MTSSFVLTLDTQTHVGVKINGGKGQTESDTVTLELALDADAVEVKVWGDLNPLDPANAGFGQTEEEAEWLTASPEFLVNLTTNPGQKRLNARVRDDVGNEESNSATIIFGEAEPLPIPPVTPPLPATGGPEVVPPIVRHRVVTTTRVPAVRGRATIHASGSAAPRRAGSTSTARSGITVAHHIAGDQVQTRVETSVAVRTVAGAAVASPAGSSSVTRRDDPEFLALLEALGIL